MTSLPAELQCPDQEVALGEPLRCQLRVRNPTDLVGEISVEGIGPAAAWVTSQPERRVLGPRQEDVITLVVTIPEHADLQAGHHRIAVRVDVGLRTVEPLRLDIPLRVPRRTELALTTEPSSAVTTGKAVYTVIVDNHSNHDVEVGLQAHDGRYGIPAMVVPDRLRLDRFETATAQLVVDAQDRGAEGDHQHQIEVHARQHGGDLDERVDVLLIHRPAAPAEPAGPLRRTVAFALDLAAVVVAWWIVVDVVDTSHTSPHPNLPEHVLGFTLVMLAYFVGAEGTVGRTPGKALLGCRVRRADDGDIGGITASVRRLPFLLPTLLWLVAAVDGSPGWYLLTLLTGFAVGLALLVSVAADDRSRGVHDRLAGTVVVRSRDAKP